METLCLKCVQKEPGQRYPGVDEVAAELDRFLKGQPIRARPIGAFARGLCWCRRKPALAAALAVVVTLAVVSSLVAVRMAIEREGRERELYRASIHLAERHFRPLLIARLEAHALVDAEARVLPGAHIGHLLLGDSVRLDGEYGSRLRLAGD
jgi:hypothetical protein